MRLGDGKRAFVPCVIDNYSRHVLACKVSKESGGVTRNELLEAALAKDKSLGLEVKPNILVDSECKNTNPEVNDLVDSELISRTIAQIDIEQINSMIEMFFYRMKHWHLFTILLSDL